jgi:hypothetical protein
MLFFLFVSTPLQAQEKIHVAISSFSASYISMFIAQKRGYYAEDGLAAEIVLMAGLTGTRALIGNSVEFGSASNPTAAVQGAKLKILMVFNDKPPGIFAAQPGFKNVSDLRGKRVGGSTVGSLDYGWMKELLPKFGLQLEKDVNFVPVGSTSTRLSALKAGTIDAAPLSRRRAFWRWMQVIPLCSASPIIWKTSRHPLSLQTIVLLGKATWCAGLCAPPSKDSVFIWRTGRRESLPSWNLRGIRTVS